MSDAVLHWSASKLVDEFFVESADEDYLVARWAAQSGLLHQYVWSASQALEKLLKAKLLKSRRPIPKTHGLLKLADELRNYSIWEPSDSARLQIPSEPAADLKKWDLEATERTPIEYLAWLEENGRASSRYRNNPVTRAAFISVHQLDAIFKELRDSISPTYVRAAQVHPLGPTYTAREGVNFHFPGIPLRQYSFGCDVAPILCYQNDPFFPELFDWSKPLILGVSMRANTLPVALSNAELFAQDDAQNDLEWLRENANLSKDDNNDLQVIATQILAHHRK